jgi:hypothetical protein
MSLSCVGNTPGLDLYFLSFCDHKELRSLQGVSKQWRVLAGNDQLWRNLFKLYFQGEMLPQTRCKDAFKRRLPVRLKSTNALFKATLTFLCCLKRDSKRLFVCSFPAEPSYSLNIVQGFGSKRGTVEGFEIAPDEIEYFQYVGEISREEKALAFFKEALTQCPEEREEPPEISFEEWFGAPAPLNIDRTAPLPFKENGIPLCTRFYGIASGGGSISFRPAPNIQSVYNFIEPLRRRFNGCVKGVDVGYGNTLGYCSEINGWKSPFKLHCIRGKSGAPMWIGSFPRHALFKFVLINAKGDMQWEKINGNRRLIDASMFGEGVTLTDSYTSNPIKF